MGTPHRGLPPPSAMTLPDPIRGPPPPLPPSLSQSLSQSLGQMPAPPSQWQGAEESMRNWLMAKAEEDRRKQEEEKTRQEGLRLEQRKIEQAMLRDSMQGGIPPHLVPLIFAGIGGANLTNMSLDYVQQHVAQLQAAQQQIQQQQTIAQSQLSPDARRGLQPQQPGYPVPPAQALPVHQVLVSQPHLGTSPTPPNFGLHGISSSRAVLASAGASDPRQPSHPLPRLTTNEMLVRPPPMGPLHSGHHQEQPSSSPSIYFHHWVPPATSGSKESKGSDTHQSSLKISESEYSNSPKKRKAVGSHEPAPPPSNPPFGTSPPFSQISSTSSTPGVRRSGHTRNRSDASSAKPYDVIGRSVSRRNTGSSAVGPNQHPDNATSALGPPSHLLQSQGPEERNEPREAQFETAHGRQSPYLGSQSRRTSPKREESRRPS